MNKAFIFLFALFLSVVAKAETYLCNNQGLMTYTTIKINHSCVKSKLDGVSGSLNVQSADEISQIWQDAQFGSFDEAVILPRAPQSALAKNESLAAHKNQQRAAKKTVAALPLPSSSVTQWSRQAVLRQELTREKAALTQTRLRFQAAQKQQDKAAIQRLQAQITDRELNIRAIEQELRR